MSSGFHFRFPRARVHRVGGNWGITLSGDSAPRKTVYRYLVDAGSVAQEMVRLQRETSNPVTKPETGVVRPCPGCGRLTRPQKAGKDKFPEAIARVDGAGRCSTCYTKNRKGIPATPPRTYKQRPADEPATVPMTAAEVQKAMPAPRGPRPAPLKPVSAPVVTDVVKEATQAYIPPATIALGPHYLRSDQDGEPACNCGWDPYLEADFCDDKSAAVTAVRIHLRKVRTRS